MSHTKNLYLVSAEKFGLGYWYVGVTDHINPLNHDPSHFLECYRKELLGASSANDVAKAISQNISNLISLIRNDGYPLASSPYGFSYDLPLALLEDIFDFWFETYKTPLAWSKCVRLLKFRSKISFSDPSILNGFISSTANYAKQIEELHSFRPSHADISSMDKEPMWP